MFGRMMITPIAHVGADTDLQAAVKALLRIAEQAEIVRWIEFPASVLLFLWVQGDPESGAVYILDRKKSKQTQEEAGHGGSILSAMLLKS